MTEFIEVDLDEHIAADRLAWENASYSMACVEVEKLRKSAYQLEADPLFFKYQRDEDGVTKAAWLAKVEEIRERYPLPDEVS